MSTLPVIERDEWLAPDLGELLYRYDLFEQKLHALEPLVDFANAHLFFGFQRDERGWVFRDWLPGAHTVTLFGDFNDWQRPGVELKRGENGVWECRLPETIKHGDRIKMLVDGIHERIPAYIRFTHQDPETKNFSGVFWAPEPFDWGEEQVLPNEPLLIYRLSGRSKSGSRLHSAWMTLNAYRQAGYGYFLSFLFTVRYSLHSISKRAFIRLGRLINGRIKKG